MSNVEQAAVIDGAFVGTMIIPLSRRQSKIREKQIICPLCKTKVMDGTNGRFYGSNYKLFPNVICHEDCVEETGGHEAVCVKLKAMNDRFKQLKDELDKEFGVIGWYRRE